MNMDWISLKDRRPPKACYVLIAIYDARENVKMYFTRIAEMLNADWYCACDGRRIDEQERFVTHWMHLPGDPEEKPEL